MSWQLLLAISIISISIANLYQRVAMKEEASDPFAGAIIFQIILAILTGVFALLIRGINFPPVNLIGYFGISTVLYGLGTLSYFKAIKTIEASESTILASIGSVVTLVTAYIFLGERLNLQQLVGVVFVLISVSIISLKKGLKFNKGVLFSILGTSFYGLAVTNDVYVLRHFDALSYTPIMSLLPGIFILLLKPSSIISIIETIRKPLMKPLILYCFFYGIQAITYYAALENGALASRTTVIYKSEIFITVMLAAIFLNERSNMKQKIFATVISTIGVILLI